MGREAGEMWFVGFEMAILMWGGNVGRRKSISLL
jgi:hypothetical protein